MPNRKARIYFDGRYWVVNIDGYEARFNYQVGAFNLWLQREKFIVRELKAWAKLQQINMRLLSMHDTVFIQKLVKHECANITKRQYGYLSGIYERQQI